MDKIDEKLLAELDINPRIRMTRLAKKLRISQQVADYRIKRLQSRGDISKFGAIINLKALGQEHYRIFFTFNSNQYSQNDIFSYLKSKKGVYWFARVGGRYDLLIVLFVFDFEGLDNFIDELNQKFPGLIKDYKTCYGLEHYFFKHKYESKDYSSISYGYNDKKIKIDELDKHILSKLKDNCRLSSIDLIKGNVSYKTVLNRIKNLEKNKVILGYRMFIKSEEMKPFILLVSFKDYSKEQEKALLKYCSNEKKITQLVRLFGIWNLFINIRAENLEKAQEIMINLRDRFNIIDSYEIIPIFEDIAIDLLPITI